MFVHIVGLTLKGLTKLLAADAYSGSYQTSIVIFFENLTKPNFFISVFMEIPVWKNNNAEAYSETCEAIIHLVRTQNFPKK